MSQPNYKTLFNHRIKNVAKHSTKAQQQVLTQGGSI
jgi:hypothetical protein